MSITRAALSPLDHQIVAGALHDLADELWRDSGDRHSSLSQRLADALVELARRAGGRSASSASSADSNPAPRPRSASRPSVLVLLDETDLRHRADAVGVGRMLDGTPLAPAELRRLLCEADIVPVVLSGQGEVLDFGRSRRFATEKQWQALVARDGGCIVAGCTAAVSWTIAHHCAEWGHHGRTDVSNLCLLCPTHHRQVHQEGWTAQVNRGQVRLARGDGSLVATRSRHGPNPMSPHDCRGSQAVA